MGVLVNSSHTTLTSPTSVAFNAAATPLYTSNTAMPHNYTSTSPSVNTTASTMTATTTTTSTTTVMASLCQNGSMQFCPCVSPDAGNQTRGMLSQEGSLDALLYIVVVLLFYAFSIVVLMVKYIRRENKEAYLRQYFEEFVARDQFQSARARNQICLKTIMDKRMDTDLREYIKLDMAPRTKAGEDPDQGQAGDQGILFSIPEHVTEDVEEDDEEVEFESAEDDLFGQSPIHCNIRTENGQIDSLEERFQGSDLPV